MSTPLVTLDTCGSMVEVTVWPTTDSAGLSVLVSAADWAAIVARGEELEPVANWRRREQRETASHEARASRR